MSSSKVVYHGDVLRRFGLSRNPYIDRTAEQSGDLDEVSLFIPSDLRHFRPSGATFLFFGKRGSGKTTIRMMMQKAYKDYNDNARREGSSRGFFLADLTRPSHLTARLRAFQDSIDALNDTWDSTFADSWTLADFVDSIISLVISSIASFMGSEAENHSITQQEMVDCALRDPHLSRQILLLAHLYADCDAQTLEKLRSRLLPQRISSRTVALGGGATVAAVGATVGISLYHQGLDSHLLNHYQPVDVKWRKLGLVATLAVTGFAGLSWAYSRATRQRSLERAASIQQLIRVIPRRSVNVIASLLDATFSSGDNAETIRSIAIGISAHQKLEKLTSLLKALGYEGLAIFGDGFDEVGLLDPVIFPTALKAFARQACRSDFLNQGRIHLFFPDTRLALDLSTDKILKEARFDRHFVRDLTWSRHQLEALAERRFLAAQLEYQKEAASYVGTVLRPSSIEMLEDHDSSEHHENSKQDNHAATFSDLFSGVSTDDLSSYLSKISTPRELMIMMNETFARLEAHPEEGITAQDLEIATSKALEQAV